MIIIAFSDKTTKILPRILCRGLKHTAPIGVYQDKLIMHQFISAKQIKQIHLNMRDLQILQQHSLLLASFLLFQRCISQQKN